MENEVDICEEFSNHLNTIGAELADSLSHIQYQEIMTTSIPSPPIAAIPKLWGAVN